jgi:hypothetical protein
MQQGQRQVAQHAAAAPVPAAPAFADDSDSDLPVPGFLEEDLLEQDLQPLLVVAPEADVASAAAAALAGQGGGLGAAAWYQQQVLGAAGVAAELVDGEGSRHEQLLASEQVGSSSQQAYMAAEWSAGSWLQSDRDSVEYESSDHESVDVLVASGESGLPVPLLDQEPSAQAGQAGHEKLPAAGPVVHQQAQQQPQQQAAQQVQPQA